MKRSIVFAVLLLTHCGGGSSAPQSAGDAGGGALKLNVGFANSTTAQSARTKVAKYRVVISAAEISPISVELDGNSDGGVIDGVPAGTDRTIEVVALNEDGEEIRAGDVGGVEVRSGETTGATVNMDLVPIFANLRNGGVVYNSRFRAEVVGEPGDAIIVEAGPVTDDAPSTSTSPLIDASVNSAEVHVDESSGVAVVAPPRLTPGKYRLIARNSRTGRASSLTISLIDGTKRRGAPLVTASAGLSRAGSSTSAWPGVVSALGNEK